MKTERTNEGYRILTDVGDVVSFVSPQPDESDDSLQQRAAIRALTYSLIHEADDHG